MRFAYTYRSSDGQRHMAEVEAESRDAAFAHASPKSAAHAHAGGRWIVRPFGSGTMSGSWQRAGRSRGMFL